MRSRNMMLPCFACLGVVAPRSAGPRCSRRGSKRRPGGQVLEILSHVNKRVRGHGEIKMPLDALLAQYAAPGAAPLVRNFALVYLEMAYERVPEDARLAAVRSAKTPFCKPPGPGSCLLRAVPPRGWSVPSLY